MAVFNVTNLFDSGLGSLRQAILDANVMAGADAIQFSSVTGTIPLTSGQLSITDSLSINGPGASLLSVSGNDSSRVFSLNDFFLPNAIDVVIDGLTITEGNTTDNGGGISNNGENLTLSNSTVSGNTASSAGGGVFNNDTDINTLNLANTIIANSPNGGDCLNSLAIATNINNLIEDGTCNPLLSGDPNLGPLQDNGGPTFTQALLPSSIAIDAGSNAAIPPGITTDQRGPGFPRIINGTVDIGAYEASQNIPPTVPEPSSLFGVLTLGLVAIGSVRRRRK